MERKWWSLETLLIVGAVFLGIVVLLRIFLARSQTVVQPPQNNPWVALIDASPGLVKTVGDLVGGIFTKHDESPSGIDANWVDSDVAPFLNLGQS
jgi:hypothetical protein